MAVISQLEPWQQTFEQSIVYKFEGLSATMYLDTVGLVTVGRGCQISAAEAQTLPFTFLGRAASSSEILSDYNRVQNMRKGHEPSFYSTCAAGFCILPPFAIEALCQSRIQSATALLRGMFPDFSSWPNTAKIATLEMPWGLRNFTSAKTFPLWKASVRLHDWNAAAKECVWSDPDGIYKVRNANRVKLYMQAAQEVG